MKNEEQVAFEAFATIYPHEAFEQDQERFCIFVRSKGNDLTADQIEKILKDPTHAEEN